MQIMHNLAKQTFPDLQEKVRMQINPNFVAAVGAAQRARNLMLDPEFRAKLGQKTREHDEL